MIGLGGKSLPLSMESLGLAARGVDGMGSADGKGLAFQGAGMPEP